MLFVPFLPEAEWGGTIPLLLFSLNIVW